MLEEREDQMIGAFAEVFHIRPWEIEDLLYKHFVELEADIVRRADDADKRRERETDG